MSGYISPEELLEKLRPVAEQYLYREVTPARLSALSAELRHIIHEEIGNGKIPEGVEAKMHFDSACDEIHISVDPTPWRASFVEEIPPTPIPTPTKEEKKLNNIVIITHSTDVSQYLFAVPEGVSLKKGEQVIVRTRRGERFGTCDCDSFAVEDDVLQALARRFSATLPLKPIVGRAVMARFGEERTQDTPDEERQTEVETLRIENARLRDELARLNRENFWLTQAQPTEIDIATETAETIARGPFGAIAHLFDYTADQAKGEN